MPILKATITITLLAEASNPDELRNKLDDMELSQIVYEIADGDWTGRHVVGDIEQVAPENIEAELEAVGSPGFFDAPPVDDRPE